MFPKVGMSIEKTKTSYNVKINEPPVERMFPDEVSTAEYLASKFTMPLDEAREILRKAENGCCIFICCVGLGVSCYCSFDPH